MCPVDLLVQMLTQYDRYKGKAKLGGVIYLHDISAPRFSGTARRNLQMFRSLCGEDALENVVLGTTKWILNVPDSELRDEQLKDYYWKPLIEKGAVALRFDNTYHSAWKFIEELVGEQALIRRIALQIQTELAVDKKIIPETEAGRELRYTLQEILKIQEKLRNLNATDDEEARTQRQEAQEKIKVLTGQIQRLKIPILRPFSRFFQSLFK